MSINRHGIIENPTTLDWRDRLDGRDRQAADAVSKWLRRAPWQLFATLTFPYGVRAETAEKKLKELVNLLEKEYRATISYVAARESKPFSYGGRVPEHFHILLASQASLSKERVAYYWSRLVRGYAPEHAKVETYDDQLLGPEYCLKAINDPSGDWFLCKVEQFLPGVGGPSHPNHHTIRAVKRAEERATRFRRP